jgi:hypothetical protein
MRRDMRRIYICGSDTNLVTAPALYVWDVVWWFMRVAIYIYIFIRTNPFPIVNDTFFDCQNLSSADSY